jgi:glycosyltransferase involved in cell wall biosynthesis
VLPDERLVYYNLDDYSLYRPGRSDRTEALEDELIERAHITLCLSRYQVRSLSERHPDRADRIYHFPLGVTEAFLNPDPASPPEPNTVTYIGNLSARVDWPLVEEVVDRCRNLRFVFVGSADETREEAWAQVRARVFARQNVEHAGFIPQEQVTDYYWSAAANWVPYDVDHPFNKAACPTKIMDSLASGRPVVSTPTPEFRLYPNWVDLADTPESMARSLREAVSNQARERNAAQVQFAAQHTWTKRAEQLLSILHGSH